MKKTGRGASYRAALADNLVKSLLTHKKILTTRARGKQLVINIRKQVKEKITMSKAPARRGDNAPQVIVEIINLQKENQHVTGGNKAKPNTKSMASR